MFGIDVFELTTVLVGSVSDLEPFDTDPKLDLLQKNFRIWGSSNFKIVREII